MPPIDAVLGEDGWEVQPIVNLTTPPATTWARRAVVSGSFGTSRGLCFFTDVGEHGTLMQWTGTRWRALNGAAALKALGNATGNIANSETIILQTLLPAGAWQVNDILRIWMTMTKSGTTDTGLVTVRVGTLGTTSDTAITGLSGYGLMAAAGIGAGVVFDIKLASATSAQRLGPPAVGLGTYTSGSSGGTAAAATTITDASANPLYVSLSIYSGGATNTVAATFGSIQLITP